MKNFGKFLLYLFLSLGIILLYIYLSNFWINCVEPTTHNQFYLELPLLMIIVFFLYVPRHHLIKNVILSIIPILALYLLYDVFYTFLKRSATISDVQNIVLLKDFSLLMVVELIGIVLLVTIPLFILFFTKSTKKKLYPLLSAKLILITLLSYLVMSNQVSDYFLKNFNYINWSQARTIKYNGRLASFIYYNIMSELSAKKVLTYQNKKININRYLFGETTLKEKRNVYFVVLESFIDPRLFKNITYNRTPMAKELTKYLGNQGFSHIISPIYGGGTAQAEFEVLTGIKALAKIDSVDFNTLMGNQISGFVNKLSQNSYHTYATVATSSEYFNSKSAYKSIGLNQIQFLEECGDCYVCRAGDEKIFDGDLYDHNIKQISQLPKNENYFFYTLGMYGHLPYHRNDAVRPDKIYNSTKDPRIHLISNQFYYRTKALAKYIDEILAIDPHSIIYITSDHLPPVVNGGIEYQKSKYINISLLLKDGKNINIDGLHYYQVPRYIWQLMGEVPIKLRDINETKEENLYFKELSESFSRTITSK